MSLETDITTQDDKQLLAKTSSCSETLLGSRAGALVCRSKPRGSSPLERALITLGRDSELRSKFLRKRWQGSIERLRSRDEPGLTTEELWWSRRHRTPLGRALSSLNRK